LSYRPEGGGRRTRSAGADLTYKAEASSTQGNAGHEREIRENEEGGKRKGELKAKGNWGMGELGSEE